MRIKKLAAVFLAAAFAFAGALPAGAVTVAEDAGAATVATTNK